MKTTMTIREYLKRFDSEQVERLLRSAHKGSDKASGIHLPNYCYEGNHGVLEKEPESLSAPPKEGR